MKQIKHTKFKQIKHIYKQMKLRQSTSNRLSLVLHECWPDCSTNRSIWTCPNISKLQKKMSVEAHPLSHINGWWFSEILGKLWWCSANVSVFTYSNWMELNAMIWLKFWSWLLYIVDYSLVILEPPSSWTIGFQETALCIKIGSALTPWAQNWSHLDMKDDALLLIKTPREPQNRRVTSTLTITGSSFCAWHGNCPVKSFWYPNQQKTEHDINLLTYYSILKSYITL